jgi:hypothetical protein
MPLVREGTIHLDAIVFEEKHYPRCKPDTTRIEKYVDDMRKGDIFPPIILLEGNNSLIDGYHRWKARIKYNRLYASFLSEEFADGLPKPTEDLPCQWHTLPEGVLQLLYASKFQNKQGLAKSNSDDRDTARRAYLAQPGISKALLEDYIGVSRHKLAEFLRDLEAKHEETVHHSLLRLDMLGWTQDEMALALEHIFPGSKGTSQKTVSNIFSKNGTVAKITEECVGSNHSVETLAKRSDMPLILAWALKLASVDDIGRFKALAITIQPYDVLHFQECDDRFGTDAYPGRIPGQLIAHVLYWFTKPGDVVIDPMAGGGTVPDVCLALGRKCYAYDINHSDRIDIIPHNLATDGWPERTKKADLVVWDPPYFRKKDDGYPDGSISRLERGPYLDFFKKTFTDLQQLVKRGTALAFLMSDWYDAPDAKPQRPGIFLWDYVGLLRHAGWHMQEHIQVPLSTQQVESFTVTTLREAAKRARLERYLLIATA